MGEGDLFLEYFAYESTSDPVRRPMTPKIRKIKNERAAAITKRPSAMQAHNVTRKKRGDIEGRGIMGWMNVLWKELGSAESEEG